VVWTIEFAESVGKSVEKLDSETRRRIRTYLDQRIANLDDPRSQGKPLTGPLGGLWRYGVGDYRIIYEIQDRKLVILVVKIDHRRDVYRQDTTG
jgi:mRNA interferase RelE/StbE